MDVGASYAPHHDYAAFKAELYARIDPQFREFFPPRVRTKIRLDEIDWGGVPVNGIPPLRSPKTLPAFEATWLRDGHIVFGVVINGEARAYPKRILVYERGSHSFRARDGDGGLRDTGGQRWNETADALVSENGVRLARIPAHRAFWFGWVAQYPETVLHK